MPDILKNIALFCVYTGLELIVVIALTTLYTYVMKPAKIKNKKRLDVRIYYFLKRNHKNIGLIIIFLFLCHALGMITYIFMVGGTKIPMFGALTIIMFLLVALSGMNLFYKMRTSTTTPAQKTRAKILHLVLITFAIVFAFIHYNEVNPKPAPVENIPIVE